MMMISAHLNTCGSKEMERYHFSIVFSLMGPVAIELCQQCITVNLLLQQVQCIIKKTQEIK